ncbi:uncharacterized protein LOC123012121 [Tribolium madens]|uniref:uncharacterized protein LOC123012121 n=1 Tax=Tribolium madens TaxID=41895 RepID=UPI001CF73BE6|nr:uncharacterized protein LOC123012121 [Tribolium madens]
MLQITLFLFISLFSNCLCLQDDYYWRDYTNGEVPSDAIVGGQNSEGLNIYIGQAYIHGKGNIVTEIFSGIQEVYATTGTGVGPGIVKTTEAIKILCGPGQNLYWTRTNRNTVHSLLVNHDAVIGGYQLYTNTTRGTLNIGRHIAHNKIGRIDTFNLYPYLYFNNNTQEDFETTFEILLYTKNKNIDSKSDNNSKK